MKINNLNNNKEQITEDDGAYPLPSPRGNGFSASPDPGNQITFPFNLINIAFIISRSKIISNLNNKKRRFLLIFLSSLENKNYICPKLNYNLWPRNFL